ncbi:MAG: putative glycosyltransferase, exosortase G system-associated [Olsenella sp.]|jgi:putative glycosyltransferase (exosortase G-associated)|nr:putative glycosyltransferase, exosortase G system-associated [Olsenella sp.]
MTAQSVLSSFVFWSAWIIIPLIVEIIPSFVSIFVLARRRIRDRKAAPDPSLWPEVSVIVPVYNSARTLEACLASIDGGTYPTEQLRVFLVDNGSSDDSFDVFARCQNSLPYLRMQWLRADQGKSKALNMALYNTEAKYIVNIDSDGTLDPKALTNLVRKFENHPKVNCMTGAVLTDPAQIEETPTHGLHLLRRIEFVEYAQAFLAGRSYSSEINAIYTLSGAFSAFRKSAILKSRMYTTDTVSEDTDLTFQMRYIQHERVAMCDDAIFLVSSISGMNELYTQRQRWQRGTLEVARLFPQSKLRLRRAFSDINVYTLVFDHTFAFPRLIWYVALLFLMAMNVSVRVILFSVLLIFALYVIESYLYFACALALLRMDPPLRRYYLRQWWVVALLPPYNTLVFFFRVAGIINSVDTSAAWHTRNLSEEWADFRRALRETLDSAKDAYWRAFGVFNDSAADTQATQPKGDES